MESYLEIGCPKFGMKREVDTNVHLKAHMTGSLLTMLQTVVTFCLQKGRHRSIYIWSVNLVTHAMWVKKK